MPNQIKVASITDDNTRSWWLGDKGHEMPSLSSVWLISHFVQPSIVSLVLNIFKNIIALCLNFSVSFELS